MIIGQVTPRIEVKRLWDRLASSLRSHLETPGTNLEDGVGPAPVDDVRWRWRSMTTADR